MSTGRAQAITWRFPDEPNWKLGHFEAGTATPKTIWTDADKTTPAASPAVADANGSLTLYGDGNYKFTFDSSVDVEIADDADDYQLTADTAIQWEDDHGASFPGASSDNEMQFFMKRDGTKTWWELAFNIDGTVFESIAAKKSDGTFEVAGQIIGIKRVLDVKDFGATGDGSTDDTTAIQNTINAVSSTGDAVYFPRGIYKCTSALTHANDPITLFGDGIGISVLKFTSAASNGFDFNFDTITDNLNMWGLSIYTEKAGGGDAINANWPSATSEYINCKIRDVEIAPTVALKASAYWTNGIVLSNAKSAYMDNILYRGESTNGFLSTSAITLDDACDNTTMDDLKSFYTTTGILGQGTSQNIQINTCRIEITITGINFNFGSSEASNKILGCHIEADVAGVVVANCLRSHITNNSIFKRGASTSNFIGIELDTSSSDNIVTGNYVRNDGSAGGTEDGIKVTDGDRNDVSNNTIIGVDGKAIWMAANATNCQIGMNLINGAGTEYQDDGTDNLYLAEWVYGSITVASASTITLPNYGSHFTITGTTDINTITASPWIGREVTLRGAVSANFDLKESTDNLRLNGAADKTLTENDTIKLAFSNSVWAQTALHSDNAAT